MLTTNNEQGELRAVCPPAAQRGRTAGAQSPHVVIRGEITPHNKIANKSASAPLQTAHIDWLSFTLTPPPEALQEPIPWVLPQVFKLLDPHNSLTVPCVITGNGWNGYTNLVKIGEKEEYGLIAYGGEKQRGTVHVVLKGMACSHILDWQSVQQWCESISANITRVDLAHDDIEARDVSIAIACAWYKAGGFNNSGRPPAARLIDDMGSGKGKTLYIGARTSGKMLRVYEKGRQLGDPTSPWVRVELELRNKSRVIPWEVLTTPTTYLAGGYPCLAFLSTVQDKIRTITKAVQITLGSIQHYLRTAGGKSINVLMQANGEDAEALIEAIRRDGIPRRLVNYSDFLPTIFETSHGQVTLEGET